MTSVEDDFGGGSVAKSCLTLATPRTEARQAPLSMGIPRQEYWDGLPFPSPGDLLVPEIELVSPVLADRFFTTVPPGKPCRLSDRHGNLNAIIQYSDYCHCSQMCPSSLMWHD